MPAPDLDVLRQWIGRSETATDVAAPGAAALLAATLDQDQLPVLGDPLPIAWHWLYFLSPIATFELGEDGMPRRGGFMPPVELPRRMWAGSRIEIREPIRLGERLQRRLTVSDIRAKEGRSGSLIFVRVTNEISTARGTALTEDRDIVFSDHSPTGASSPRSGLDPPSNAMWHTDRTVSPVLLFRYSALTFNSHRIHYDRRYTMEVEGYRGLVVQGPLLATLLAESLSDHVGGASVRAIAFRALGPIFADERFEIAGRCETSTADAWAVSEGRLAMTAHVELE